MSQNVNTVFCRLMLKNVMEDVRLFYNQDTINHSWAYMWGHNSGEFHINKCEQVPQGYYVTVSAYDKYEAKAKGWNKFLESQGHNYDEIERIKKEKQKPLKIPNYSFYKGFPDEGVSAALGKPSWFRYSELFLKRWYNRGVE